MEIFCYMNQKQKAAVNGEKTGINFPYLNLIKKETPVQKIVKQIYRGN